MAAAYAARKLGLPATVVVPSSTGPGTVRRLQELGATVEVCGKVGRPPPKLGLGGEGTSMHTDPASPQKSSLLHRVLGIPAVTRDTSLGPVPQGWMRPR